MRCGSVSWVSGLVCVCAVLSGGMGQPVDDGVDGSEDEVLVTPETEGISNKTTNSTPAAELMDNSNVTLKSYVHQSQYLSDREREFVLRRKQVVLKSLNKLGVKCKPDSVPHIALLGSGGGERAVVGFLGSLYQLEKEGLLDSLLYLGGVSASAWTIASLYKDPQWSTDIKKAVYRRRDPASGLKDVLSWMGDEAKEKYSFLTDIWGDLTSGAIMRKLDFLHFPEDDMNVTNPYPLYSAVNRDCLRYGPENAKWFEITPHEAGFTDLGFYVDTSYLHSTMYEEDPEGTGNPIPDWLKDKLSINPFGKKNEEQTELTQLRQYLLAPLEYLDEGLVKSKTSWLIEKTFSLIEKMEWGTIKNFLQQFSDDEVPSCLRRKKQLQLMDAGVGLNVPFPAFLGEKRDMDLLIVLEYGAHEIFKTLTLARDYALELNKPFPDIDNLILEYSEWPEDLYIFEGKEQEPTIVYMPLFNKRNCKDSQEFQERIKAFSTFQLSFKADMLDFLLETAKTNIKNNKKTLLRVIQKAAVRRQKNKRVEL